MEALSLWTYPGTWIGLGVMVVLLGGLVIFALTLRRTLRRPPLDEPVSTPNCPDSENTTTP